MLDAAEALFAARGYEETATEQILAASGMSRGALYHHFATKKEVFEAVFSRVSARAIERAVKRAGKADASPLASLIDACIRWLDEVRRPENARILIDEGPLVLGWERARELEADTSLGLMVRGLERAEAAGEVEVESIELSARFLNALLAEAALAALYREPRLSRAALERSIRAAIEGLVRGR